SRDPRRRSFVGYVHSTQRLTSLESSDTTLPAQAGDDWRLLALVRRLHPGLHGTQQPLDRVHRLAAFLQHALRVEVPRVARLEELPELPDHMPEPAGELDVGERRWLLAVERATEEGVEPKVQLAEDRPRMRPRGEDVNQHLDAIQIVPRPRAVRI